MKIHNQYILQICKICKINTIYILHIYQILQVYNYTWSMKRHYYILHISFNITSIVKYLKYLPVNLKYMTILEVWKNTIYIVQICFNIISMIKYLKYLSVNLKYIIILEVLKITICIVQMCFSITSMLNIWSMQPYIWSKWGRFRTVKSIYSVEHHLLDLYSDRMSTVDFHIPQMG